MFVSTLKDLEKREKLDVNRLSEKDFNDLFDLLKKGKIMKESIGDVLKLRIENKGLSITECVKKLDLEYVPEGELRKMVREIISKNKNVPKGKIVGFVMSKVRGKANPKDVVRIVDEETD